jgi:hypothetical protein
VFESLRTEDFCYGVSLVLRIMNFTTHKDEISLSNLSGYGHAILGATPNISFVSHKHVDNDMCAIEVSDHLGCVWTLRVTASRKFGGEDVRLLGSSAGDTAQTKGSRETNTLVQG